MNHRQNFKKNIKVINWKKPKNEDDSDGDNDNDNHLTDSLISVNGNTVMFHSDITAKTSFLLINAMKEAIRNINELNRTDPTSVPIKLHINTNGGEVYKVLAIISFIKSIPYEVHTICEGCVASAGVLLSIAGDKRYMYENAYMLVHEIRSGMWGKYSECIDDMYNNKRIMKDIKKYFKKQSNDLFKEEQMESILKRDIILKAKKCLKYGLIDEIIYFEE